LSLDLVELLWWRAEVDDELAGGRVEDDEAGSGAGLSVAGQQRRDGRPRPSAA
jgi:hypothetical protein